MARSARTRSLNGSKTLLRKACRQRNLAATAAKIKTALGTAQLGARPGVVPAYAVSVSALVAVLTTMIIQTEVLAGRVEQGLAGTRTWRSA